MIIDIEETGHDAFIARVTSPLGDVWIEDATEGWVPETQLTPGNAYVCAHREWAQESAEDFGRSMGWAE